MYTSFHDIYITSPNKNTTSDPLITKNTCNMEAHGPFLFIHLYSFGTPKTTEK